MKKRIYLSSPQMSQEGYEKEFINEAFDTNWIAPLGPNVEGFEKEFAEKVKIGYAAALNTGTAAIHLALKALGVGEGDIVFCPTLTFSATVNPIIYEKAVPVFIDSDEKSWNMDPVALEQAFLKYPQVKAVIIVHLYGLSADLEPLLAICQKHQVAVIEDAAESLGCLYRGKQTGTFGDFGVFSFNGNKIITTSGGGMLVSDDEAAVKKVRFWATQSRDSARHYQHSELGYNYRLSNICAGIGRGQLKVLDQHIQKKREIFETYQKALNDLEGVAFMPINDWNEPNYWLSCMTVSQKGRNLAIMERLEKENIESRPIWKPMHQQPIFEKYDCFGGSVSEKLFETGICLPSDTNMSREEQLEIIALIKELWE